jgi:hypothetical protein
MSSGATDFQNSGLANAIHVVRKRTVTNRWIELWTLCCNWTLAALVVAVALVRSVRVPLTAALFAAIVAAIATAIGAWYARPSAYGLAQSLDSAGRLGDRVSTAVFFWGETNPSEVIVRQRGDALAHLGKVQPEEMFPVHLPPKMWRSWALLGAVAALCAYHAAYGPAIPELRARAMQSHALAGILSPLTRAIEFARAEKRELADLVAGDNRDRQANDKQKPAELPPTAQMTGAAKAAAAEQAAEMSQALQMANASTTLDGQGAKAAQMNQAAGQQAGVPSNAQAAAASAEQQPGQAPSQGQQSLGQRALQALENLMSSALSGEQNSAQSTQNASPVNNPGTTAAQAMSGSSQMATSASQAAQGQTSNSQGAQNQTTPNPGKHTGAGNGSSPWMPREDKDPQLAGNNMAKEHVQLQTTGFRGAPGKERADVAPGTAQIPLQNVAPQTVTTVNGAGQDSVPPRYRQYVQDYFQHSEK